MIVRYLTHPQVRIDPDVPVPDWGLSDAGRARACLFARHDVLRRTGRVVSSGERKAVETAEIIASGLDLEVEIRGGMGENDRSATGFVPPDAFEAMADRFFAEPQASICGWERAIDAQARIVTEMEAILADDATDDILCVGHGGVGTLLYCHYANLEIDRAHDQPQGGGHHFAIARDSRNVLHGWRPIEA